MEKKKYEMPHVDKAVGERPENQEAFERHLTNLFLEKGGKKIEEFEIEKTERDIEIIKLAEKAVAEYLKQYGRKKDIKAPLANIHLFQEGGVEKYTRDAFAEGAHSTTLGSIIADRKKSDVDFALLMFHELFHMKSYKAMQKTTRNKLFGFREGFAVVTRDGSKVYFENVEEAIIGHMTKRFYYEVLSKEKSFAKEIEEMEKSGKKIDFSREAEQREGNKFIDALWEQNKDKFKDRNEIVDLFIEAQVTGKLLKVARLVEKTFGKGSFRKLGEETGVYK